MFRRVLITALSMAALISGASPEPRVADAAMQGDRAAIQSLLKQHAGVNVPQGDGMTALHWAAFKDDLEMAKMLLAAGANVKAVTREEAIPPLLLACTNGDAAMIEAFLKAGADANAVNSNGTTALMTAAASGNADAVKLLLDHGAAVNAKESAHGQTALMFAASLNRDAVIKVLMAHGADANIATPVKAVPRVRFDQDGNIVEERPGGRGGRAGARSAAAPKTAAEAGKADEAADAEAAAAARKAADETAMKELDALSHALGFTSAAFLPAKTKARAGDVAARAEARRPRIHRRHDGAPLRRARRPHGRRPRTGRSGSGRQQNQRR